MTCIKPISVCTPWNSVLNPQFDETPPLNHWNVSNIVETGFANASGYLDEYYYSAPTAGPALSYTLSSAGPDSASTFQSIEVCPFRQYTFEIFFVWSRTDYLGFVATNSASQNCFLILSLGTTPNTVSKTYTFGTLPNILASTPLPESYGKVKLGSYYTTGAEDRTTLNITVSCTSGFASSTGYQPSPYIDDVNLLWV
jgi:hypothetical protein